MEFLSSVGGAATALAAIGAWYWRCLGMGGQEGGGNSVVGGGDGSNVDEIVTVIVVSG